ncbi:MAG: ThiF family adenylyltransferase, partial [Candidatus Hydrothermales bacterium]
MIDNRLVRLFPLNWGKNLDVLKYHKVLIVGLGALGSNILDLMIRIGFKNLILVDRDYVEFHDLLNSPLYIKEDAEMGKPKVIASQEKIKSIDESINLKIFFEDFSPSFLKDFNEDISLIVDAVDNLETRFLINEFSFKKRVPWIHGACVGERGEVSFFVPWEGSCYRCLFKEIPKRGRIDTCETHGINPIIARLVAEIQVDLAVKYFTLKRKYIDKMIYVDFSDDYSLRNFKLKKRKDCPLCVRGEFEFINREDQKIITFCSENTVYMKLNSFDYEKIKEKWKNYDGFEENRFFIRLRIKDEELKLFKEGKLFISSKSLIDEKKIRNLISKYIG